MSYKYQFQAEKLGSKIQDRFTSVILIFLIR